MKKDACEVNLRAFGGVAKRRKRGFGSEWLEREPFWTIALSRNCLLKIVRPRVNFQVNPQTGTFANFLCAIYNMNLSSAGPPIFYSKFEELFVINM